MSSAELTLWGAFYQVDAWIQERVNKGDSPSQAEDYARAMSTLLARSGK